MSEWRSNRECTPMDSNKGDSLFWKSKDFLMEHGLLIWGVVTALCIFGGCFAIIHFGGSHKSDMVRNWIRLEATVLKSELKEVNTSDETSFSTRISARVTLRYLIGSDTHDTEHVTSWQRRDHKDWSEILHPGQKISIRISPDDPKSISLIDLTGVP